MSQTACICNPLHSHKNKRCKRCFPPKWKQKKIQTGMTGHDPKRYAEIKQHVGIKLGEALLLQSAPIPVETDDEEPTEWEEIDREYADA